MTWIETIAPDDATGRLATLYSRVAGPSGQIDAILQAHSLRPRSLAGHLALYKAVLHDPALTLTPVERELIGSVVSALNGCAYCLEHHRAGLARHLGDDETRARAMIDAALNAAAHPDLDVRRRSMLAYATALTRNPAGLTREHLAPLRAAGLTDPELLELNQIVAYFAYANRTVLGLGVDHTGEPLGLHPDDTSDSLAHR